MSIAKYRRKAEELQAIQFTADAYDELSAWLPEGKHMFVASPGRTSLHLDTTEGPSVAHEGDWILREEFGDFYIYSDETFRQFYDAVEAGE